MRAGPGKPEKRDETMSVMRAPPPCMRPICGSPAPATMRSKAPPRRMEPAPPEAPLMVASLAE